MGEKLSKIEGVKTAFEYKTKEPVKKEDIGNELLIFLVTKSNKNKELRNVIDFSLEFEIKNGTGHFKFNVKNIDNTEGSVEFELLNDDLKEFISLLRKGNLKQIMDIKDFMSGLKQFETDSNPSLN